MTKPIRNSGPCFHLSLPRQRGQRDMLSHTEFINVHILHALSLPGHPLQVTRKPPTADWWVLLLALPEETIITINIVPCVKCAPETQQGGRDSPGGRVCEITTSHMGKNKGNSVLVCEKNLHVLVRFCR